MSPDDIKAERVSGGGLSDAVHESRQLIGDRMSGCLSAGAESDSVQGCG